MNENVVEEIMLPENVGKLATLDLKAYAESNPQIANFQMVLEFIVEELKHPYNLVAKPFEEMTPLDVLYKASGETYSSLRKGSIVNAQVVNTSKEQFIFFRLECGLDARLDRDMIKENETPEFHIGSFVTARIIEWAADYGKKEDRDLMYRIRLSIA
jgi:hypothetical protein